jgi:hypothetical protein
MQLIKKEIIFAFYAILILILGLLGYFIPANNKYEYSLAGILTGVLISLILWLLWGSKNSY